MPRIFSSRQVGKLVGADPSSVNRWIDSGKLNAYRTPGGHRRVLYDDLVQFLEQCGMPLPEELQPERKSILIADGDATVVRSLRRGLLRADKSLEIDTCTSGVDALLKLGVHQPDVVVLDASLPGIDAVDVCKRIREQEETSHVMVLATSGRASGPLEKKLIAAGASALLAKPLKPAKVLEAISASRN
jgi:excisionase family DNA binding protein